MRHAPRSPGLRSQTFRPLPHIYDSMAVIWRLLLFAFAFARDRLSFEHRRNEGGHPSSTLSASLQPVNARQSPVRRRRIIPKIPRCIHARHMCGKCRRALERPGLVTVASPATTMIVLLYHDQSEWDQNRRHTTLENARALKLLSAGKFEKHGAVFRLHQRAPARPSPFVPCSRSTDSCSSIALAEMKANVGEPSINESGDGEFPRHYQQQAQRKIRAIGADNYTTDFRSRPSVRVFSRQESDAHE